MSDVIGIAIDNWTAEKFDQATDWLYNMYGRVSPSTWYVDRQPLCDDLVMRKDIYFMFMAAFGEDFVTS